MPRFHINPDNKALECTARPGHCAFRNDGEPEATHYPTAEAAYAANNRVQGESMKKSVGAWDTKIPELVYADVKKNVSYENVQIGDKINGATVTSINVGRVNTTIMVDDPKKGRERKIYKPLKDKVAVERKVYTDESKEARDNALVELEFEKRYKNFVSKVPNQLEAMQQSVSNGNHLDDFSTEALMEATAQDKVHSEISVIVAYHKREGTDNPYSAALSDAAERYSQDLLYDAARGITPRSWPEKTALAAKARVVEASKNKSPLYLQW